MSKFSGKVLLRLWTLSLALLKEAKRANHTKARKRSEDFQLGTEIKSKYCALRATPSSTEEPRGRSEFAAHGLPASLRRHPSLFGHKVLISKTWDTVQKELPNIKWPGTPVLDYQTPTECWLSLQALLRTQDYVQEPCDWGGGASQSSDLTKSQHNNYSPCGKSLCINKARLFLKAEFYFATLLMKFAY